MLTAELKNGTSSEGYFILLQKLYKDILTRIHDSPFGENYNHAIGMIGH